jgi:hypothetical protein
MHEIRPGCALLPWQRTILGLLTPTSLAEMLRLCGIDTNSAHPLLCGVCSKTLWEVHMLRYSTDSVSLIGEYPTSQAEVGVGQWVG